MGFYDIAAPLAQRGLACVPVEAGLKRCRLPNWPNLATTDLSQLREWDNAYPSANVGVVAKPDGAALLDCDTPDLLARIEAETGQRLPPTMLVKSAGRGCPHVYFQQTDTSRRLGNRKAPGLFDFKVQNSYVVGPGSKIVTAAGTAEYVYLSDNPLAPFPAWLGTWIEANSAANKEVGRAPASVRPTSPLFDIHAFLDHYGLTYEMSGNWYVTDRCPVAGRKHEQSARTGFYYDGDRLGFHCFASSCPGADMTVGEVIKHLNKSNGLTAVAPYAGEIWTREPGEKAIRNDVFKLPAIAGTSGQYVLKPRDRFDGWFGRGRIHEIGASSGGGKTSMILPLLVAQRKGETYLGHEGARLPFLVLFADRGKYANQETLDRLGLRDAELPIDYLPKGAVDGTAALAILRKIEEWELPGVVFVEGGDMLVSEPNDSASVSAFLGQLQEIAEHYFTSIILSVGSPKAKPKERHTLKRDRVFGSEKWARMADTILILSDDGDGTGTRRSLDVMHRNAPAEKFVLEFRDGQLVPVSEAEQQIEEDAAILEWMLGNSPFSARQFRKAKGAGREMSPKVAQNKLGALLSSGTVSRIERGDKFLYQYASKEGAEA